MCLARSIVICYASPAGRTAIGRVNKMRPVRGNVLVGGLSFSRSLLTLKGRVTAPALLLSQFFYLARAAILRRYKRRYKLDRSLIGWIVNTARANYWRVSSWYDLEDLIQDGMECYARCKDRYQYVANQSHFMSLVKKTYINHIHNLAIKKSRELDIPVSNFVLNEIYTLQALDEIAGPQPETSTFRVLVGKLPQELKQLLMILIEDARNIPMINRPDRTRETTNEYLCRLISVNPNQYDIEDMFRRHFNGEPVYFNSALTFWM